MANNNNNKIEFIAIIVIGGFFFVRCRSQLAKQRRVHINVLFVRFAVRLVNLHEVHTLNFDQRIEQIRFCFSQFGA